MKKISYIDRISGEVKTEIVPGKNMLYWLYGTVFGRIALKLVFKHKFLTDLGGWYMNTRWSARQIARFVVQHNINMNDYCKKIEDYDTFNDFFYRTLKPDARPIEDALVAPADGKILVFPSMKDVRSFFIKGIEFSLERFVLNEQLATKYKNGTMAIVRLAPPDYHRFHFPASGMASKSTKINGHYYSVSPLALRRNLQIYCENKREHCTLSTKDYGDILIVDVGATMVGSIIQTYQPGPVKKGAEKGYFAFGGSTLVLLFEKGSIQFDSDLIENTKKGLETAVRMGENIAF